MRSIRLYLLRALAGALLLCSLVTTCFTYFNALGEVNELYDKNMYELAMTLQSQLQNVPQLTPDQQAEFAVSTKRYKLRGEEEFLVQVWRDTQLIYSSHPRITLPQQNIGTGDVNRFDTKYFDERDWRICIQKRGAITVQVSQTTRIRHGFVRELSLELLWPALAQLPLIGLLLWFAIGRGLSPLIALSEAIKKRSAHSLEPIPTDVVPVEIKPLIEELNSLLQRLGTALEIQKRFTADAAHELRTPLTALQLQLGVLTRVKNEEEREQSISKLQKGIDRATHLVQQLLILARLEPEAVAHSHSPVDLAGIATSVIEASAENALAKQIDLGAPRLEAAFVIADAEKLRILIGNLVDNALRYTPGHGQVDVLVYPQGDKAVLEVIDTGIGIPEAERIRVFERFYRLLGTETTGTGLGLAIVKNIVDSYHGTIHITSPDQAQGCRFIVSFALAVS